MFPVLEVDECGEAPSFDEIRKESGCRATAGGAAKTFAAGDRLAIINEDPADAALADLSITFLGKRT